MSVLYFVRHAHADWTPDEDRPLSPTGRRDAVSVAHVLEHFPITAIYTSSARRAQETIAPLALHLNLPIFTREDLRERRLSDQPVDDFLGAVRATWEDPLFALPGGESNAAAQHRGLAAVSHILDRHPASHIAIATHGNLLALILQHFDARIDFTFWRSLSMPDVYQLTLGPAGGHAVRRLWNDA